MQLAESMGTCQRSKDRESAMWNNIRWQKGGRMLGVGKGPRSTRVYLTPRAGPTGLGGNPACYVPSQKLGYLTARPATTSFCPSSGRTFLCPYQPPESRCFCEVSTGSLDLLRISDIGHSKHWQTQHTVTWDEHDGFQLAGYASTSEGVPHGVRAPNAQRANSSDDEF
ncbi:hypothetical protein VTN00DRAFT_1700 [Thermoascus crustaceus]|uniref:uncharacterized protein n=1 Tax=Thermoascus crustaceus TaxID=5088 RepID=UPI003742BC4B